MIAGRPVHCVCMSNQACLGVPIVTTGKVGLPSVSGSCGAVVLRHCYTYKLESCSGAGATGTLPGPRGLRGGGYGAYGESAVSGTELHRVTAGRGHAANWREVLLREDFKYSDSAASVTVVSATLPLPVCGLIMH